MPDSIPGVFRADNTDEFRVYNRRWIMLAFFSTLSSLNAVHWLQYSIIANVAVKYYRVTTTDINMSAMIFMLLYIPLVVPASYFIESKGLRRSVIFACLLTAIGSWMKMASLNREGFYIGFAAQAVIGVGQICILSLPPRLGAIWFDTNQVSTAGAIGVFGNQLGIALGFYIPTKIVHDSPDMEEVKSNLMILQILYAAPITVLLLLIIFFYEDRPKVPPNVGQAKIRRDQKLWSECVKELFEKDYIFLLISYGLNIGVFYTYSTLLNQMIVYYYPDGEADAGEIGLTLVISGAVGSLVWGVILDKMGQYKNILRGVYLSSVVGMVGFSVALICGNILSMHFASAFLGFFMNAYQTIAFEFTSEITYPVAESTSTGILIATGELAGVVLVLVLGKVLDSFGDVVPAVTMIVTLALGFCSSLLIEGNVLKRQSAARNGNI